MNGQPLPLQSYNTRMREVVVLVGLISQSTLMPLVGP